MEAESALRRLMAARGIGPEVFADRAGGPVGETVDAPDPAVLRRLAPVLGLHRSDLFIIAGRPVPDDLAPLDPGAAGHVGGLAWTLTYLPDAVPE
ncbi:MULTISPECIES: hypothetical protein [Catenuloplanes]|uniref:Uncharacterized protein n=1 Tax=Catenuloplanes niger TaxID=587534 RepID=A0AAE3ZJW4_9ACTN|nr:hypothetical protein [Catenuloplanes niger]MDR7320015.1 hypothetical protein [Catenuloplanes niger]